MHKPINVRWFAAFLRWPRIGGHRERAQKLKRDVYV